jgi:hypothetical protein
MEMFNIKKIKKNPLFTNLLIYVIKEKIFKLQSFYVFKIL